MHDRWESKQQPIVKMDFGVCLRNNENRAVTLVVYLMYSHVPSVPPMPWYVHWVSTFTSSREVDGGLGSLSGKSCWFTLSSAVYSNWSWLLPAKVPVHPLVFISRHLSYIQCPPPLPGSFFQPGLPSLLASLQSSGTSTFSQNWW